MPTRADDAVLMIEAGLLVAAVAGPIAVVCAIAARLQFGSECPRWGLPRFRWPGPAILAAFVVSNLLLTLIFVVDQAGLYRVVYPHGFPPPPPGGTDGDAKQLVFALKRMWFDLVSVPLVLLLAVLARTLLYRSPLDWRAGLQELPRAVALGVFGCFTFGTLAFVLNAGLEVVCEKMGYPTTEHPLSKLGRNGDGVNGTLLILSACVCAPLLEEFLYRRLLIPWAGARWYRPWCLLFPAALIAVLKPDGTFNVPAVAFVAVLAAGAYLIQRFGKRPKFPRHTALAVWSSSALFAAAHSAVWPTPIPLFVLGLGLGYLTARTRSWAASAVAHATFNAVSTVWVFLRG